MVNVGQLVREGHEREGVVIAGFSSYQGSVIAGQEWEAPMEKMPVPEGRKGTWEDLLHRAVGGDGLLIFEPQHRSGRWAELRGQRAIGVVYHPEYESGNYVPTVLPDRYDVFLYVDETRALHPLHISAKSDSEPPETFPWNV